MFAGHLGAAFALGRAERRINVGAFVAAALLLDALLWLFILLGRESVTIPADFAATHQPEFRFPLSHGLVATVVWSTLAAFAALTFARLDRAAKRRAAALLAAAVASHWLLDALVHAPELPLAGDGSMKVGLGLWGAMPIALAVESLVLVGGLALFVAGAGLSRRRKSSLVALSLLVLAATIAGMTVAPPPPSPQAMAASSLATIAVLVVLVVRMGRSRDGDDGDER